MPTCLVALPKTWEPGKIQRDCPRGLSVESHQQQSCESFVHPLQSSDQSGSPRCCVWLVREGQSSSDGLAVGLLNKLSMKHAKKVAKFETLNQSCCTQIIIKSRFLDLLQFLIANRHKIWRFKLIAHKMLYYFANLQLVHKYFTHYM